MGIDTTSVLIDIGILFSPALGIAGTAWLEKFRRIPYLIPCIGTAVLGFISSMVVCESFTSYFAERLMVGLGCTCYSLALYWFCLWLYRNDEEANTTRVLSVTFAVILIICGVVGLIWWLVLSTPDPFKALWWSPIILGGGMGTIVGIRHLTNK